MISLPPLLRSRSTWVVTSLLLVALLLVGCNDGTLNAPDVTNDMFERYVALGNSITAGFQSDGINENLQQQSYAVLLSEQMETPFQLPVIPAPGCPPPLTNILTGNRIGGTSVETCTLRETPIPSTVHNLAVPNAKVFDALSNLDPNASGQPPDPSPNILTSLILGGRSQVEAATQANPTFASVWLGNNNVLGAALVGRPQTSTAPPRFNQEYTQVLDQLQAAGVNRGLLIGVADVTLSPHFSPGQAYLAAEQQINALGAQASDNWGHFEVFNSCAPGAPGANTLVPFVYGFGVLFNQALQGEFVELDCDPDTAPPDVLTPSEVLSIRQTVASYNTAIEQFAQDREWAFMNPNPVFGALYQANAADGNPANDLVPKFPRPTSDQTFGRYFSEDGIHPTGDLQKVIAFLAIQAINQTYGNEGVSLEQVSIPDEVASLLQQQ